MACQECEEDTGEPVSVEYTDGNTEALVLCEECRDEFVDGGLVRDVEAGNPE